MWIRKKFQSGLNQWDAAINRRLFFLLVSPLLLGVFKFPALSLTTEVSFARPLSIRWQYSTEQVTQLTPASDDEFVFLPLAKGVLVTLQARDGKLLWQTDPGGEFSASPVIDRRRVYVATSESTAQKPPAVQGMIRALGSQTGVTIWRLQLPSPLRGSLIETGNAVLGAGDDGKLYSIEKDSGKILWATHLGGKFTARPVVSNGHVYIGGELGYLFAIEVKSGKVVWRYRTRGALHGAAAIAQEAIYIGSADGYVYALNSKKGQLLWRSRTGAEVQSVAGSRNGLIVVSLDNFIYLLSFDRGSRLWKRQMPGRIAAPPLVREDEDAAFFTPLTGDSGVALKLNDGKFLNSFYVGEDNNTSAAPVASDTLLFITTRQGLLALANDAGQPSGSSPAHAGRLSPPLQPADLRRNTATNFNKGPCST